MDHHDESGGVWPGYVAAVASLVQAMLLLLAILASAIFMNGMDVGIRAAQLAKAKAAAAAALAPRERNAAGIALTFAADAWRLDATAEANLKAAVVRLRASGVKTWRVWVRTDTSDAMSRRAGYLRLMAVRTVLMAAGVEAANLDLDLQDSGPATERDAQAQVVHVVAGSLEPRR